MSLFCYANTLSNDFCDDGIPVVRDNSKITEPNQWGVIWTTDYWSETKDATPNRDLLYRPVALSSYRLVRAIGGDAAFPQLLINMLLHALNSLLVARLCRHMGGNDAAAIVAGAVFAALPIHSEVINNVVGRADLLAVLGVLSAILLHRRSVTATTEAGVVKWRIAAAVAVFAAMGSKESALMVVPAIVLFDGYWYRRWRSASRDRSWWHPRSFLRFTYVLIPAGLNLLLRFQALGGHFHQGPALTKTVNVLVDAPWWQHSLGVLQLWGMYWVKTFWPRILCINYSINTIRLATDALDPDVIIGVFVLLAMIVVSVLAWRRGRRNVAFLCAGIVVTYFPTSNIWVLIQVFFVERIWYLPSVFVAVLAGLSVLRLKWRGPALLVAAGLVFAMTSRCWIRNAEWQNNDTLYASTYAVHRHAVGALRLHGNSLVQKSMLTENPAERSILLQEAKLLLKQAIAIDLGFTDAQRSLGHAYFLAGELKPALEHLQIADMQVPNHPPTVKLLEHVSRILSAHDTELAPLKRKVAEHPDDVKYEIALVRKLRELGLKKDALARLEKAGDRFENVLEWQVEYAVTLVYLNLRDDAIDHYYMALSMHQDKPQLLVELAMLLFERRHEGDLEEAWTLASRAESLAPRMAVVFVCKAEIVALRGNLKEAVRLYEQAIDLSPPGSEIRRNCTKRAAALGRRPDGDG
ncbi:MAG: hypothetical protein IH987_12390 [Planctomycetes bacterium]|nr:hypothetical protein [Planctomycetota bacterium]